MDAPKRRIGLTFSDCRQLLREIEQLRDRGYVATGKWDLPYIAEHIAVSMDAAMSGQTFAAPWPARMVGPLIRRVILRSGKIPGRASAPKEVAPCGKLPLERSIEIIREFDALKQPITMPHPFLGQMTRPPEWRRGFQIDPRSTSFELPGADGLPITIDIPAVADVDDEDEKLIVENSVHDPVVPNADSVPVVAGQFNRSRAARIRSECFDSPNDPTIKFTRKFSKRPGGGGRVFDLVRYDQIPNWRLSVS